ncbi:hypothetical protein ACS0TY_000093 [Phlomoides rotata]
MKSQGTQSELCSSPPPFPPPKSIPSSLLLSAEMRRPEADSLPQVQRVRSYQRRRPLQFISRCR